MGRLELEIDCGLAHSIVLPRTHGPATHAHAHGHDLSGGEGRNHWEKYSRSGLEGMDAGRSKVGRGWGGGEGVEAGADVVAEERDVDGGEVGWVGFELAEGGGKQAGGTEGIVALEVVEGDGDLNEGLEEELFGLRGGEPDGLPGFVGGEESTGVVLAEAFGERAVGPVEGHVFGRKERTTEILSEKPLRMTSRFSTTDSKGRSNMIFDPVGRVSDGAHCGECGA